MLALSTGACTRRNTLPRLGRQAPLASGFPKTRPNCPCPIAFPSRARYAKTWAPSALRTRVRFRAVAAPRVFRTARRHRNTTREHIKRRNRFRTGLYCREILFKRVPFRHARLRPSFTLYNILHSIYVQYILYNIVLYIRCIYLPLLRDEFFEIRCSLHSAWCLYDILFGWNDEKRRRFFTKPEQKNMARQFGFHAEHITTPSTRRPSLTLTLTGYPVHSIQSSNAIGRALTVPKFHNSGVNRGFKQLR